MKRFIGIDVGSLTTKIAVIDGEGHLLFDTYLRSSGGPIESIQLGFRQLRERFGEDLEVSALGTTGSGRHLASVIAGGDTVKNEITAHATAAVKSEPEVATVMDIGGQDSKIIFIDDGIVTDFNMNSICAAGTGSFLDHQAARLDIPIEEFGKYALESQSPVRIAGRCGVFAESDLIHKQQMGYKKENLIAGLCLALARNYLTNVARGKKIEPAVLFQGGVAANVGMRAAFETLLERKIVVPEHFKVMGAWGAALLAARAYRRNPQPTNFRGVERISSFECTPRAFTCTDCSNNCEINEIYIDGDLVSRWGSQCGKWENLNLSSAKYDEQAEAPLEVRNKLKDLA